MFSSDTSPVDLSELTDRELRVAQLAADLAVRKMQDEFYRNVGKAMVTRFFVWVGIIVVAFAAGKGWLILPPGK